MAMHAIAILFVLLTFPTQVVLCFFKNVNFSTPEQCGPFTVGFSGASAPPILPLSLTIVPISANPITIRLPEESFDNSSNAGTASITFLPLTSGTQFVASLDDGKGFGVGLVSDLMSVQHSNVTSCIAPKRRGLKFYHILGDLNQCSRFNVTYNPSTVKNVPSIRAFLPRSFSFPVNATDTPIRTVTLGRAHKDDDDSDDKSGSGNSKGGNTDEDEDNNSDDEDDNDKGGGGNNSNGFHPPHNISSKEYLLNVVHGLQAILALDDGEGHRESSRLFTAGGTANSPSNCFKESFNVPSGPPDASSPSESSEAGGLSRTVKIVISVLGASVLTSILAILFILCQKRRKARKDLEKTSFVFTEDVDMGSSFVSLATRIRTRISHLTYGKRSVRSYRSYRDEKDGTSTWIPTSPIGSPAPLASWNASSPRASKALSWTKVTVAPGTSPRAGSESSSMRNSRAARTIDTPNTVIFPSLEFDFLVSRSLTSSLQQPTSYSLDTTTVSRSSKSSRFFSRSSTLSPQLSVNIPIPAIRSTNHDGSIRRMSLPLYVEESSRKRELSGTILSTDLSSTGYVASRPSSVTSEATDSGIYISSPIRPASDTLDRMPLQSDPSTMPRLPAAVARNAVRNSRYSILKGSPWRDGSGRERGRILPFPIVSLRVSRSPAQ